MPLGSPTRAARAARHERAPLQRPAGPLRRRGDWLIPGALALLHLALALLAFDPTPHTGGDNAAYISLARSLLERGAYLELWDPATPQHTLYPPVFPGILALAMLAGLDSWVALKLVVVGFSAAAVVLSYLWLRRRSGPGPALAVSLLLAVSPGVLDLSHWVLSDVPFWALTMLALWAFEGSEPEAEGGHAGLRGGARRRRFALALAATVLAYFTRSAGLPLVLAAGGWLVLRRRWRELAVSAVVLVPLVLLWWLRIETAGAGGYVSEFWQVNPYAPELGRIGPAGLLERMAANGYRYMFHHLPILLIGSEGRLPAALGLLVSVLAVLGWTLRIRRPGVSDLFLPLYVGLLFVWPEVWSGERFLLPALPVILACAADMVGRGARLLRSPAAARSAGPAVALALVLLATPALVAGARRGMTCTTAYRMGVRYPCLAEPWRDFFHLAEWSRAGLSEDAVLLSRKPRLFYALSGLRGRIYPKSRDPAEFFALATEAGARYVVLDHLDQLSLRYLSSILIQRPQAFCVVRSLGMDRVTLFGILPGAAAMPDAERNRGDASGVVTFGACPADYSRPSSSPAR